MHEHTRVSVGEPEVNDTLIENRRRGAKELVAHAVIAELDVLLTECEALRDADGRRPVVRNSYPPERDMQTGIGPVSVHVPRVRDWSASGIVRLRTAKTHEGLSRKTALTMAFKLALCAQSR